MRRQKKAIARRIPVDLLYPLSASRKLSLPFKSVDSVFFQLRELHSYHNISVILFQLHVLLFQRSHKTLFRNRKILQN